MNISNDWLTERVENAPTSYHRSLAPMAALRIRMAWQKLKRDAVDGDEMWAISSPTSQPKRLGKRTGYALVRDGEILQSVIVTRE